MSLLPRLNTSLRAKLFALAALAVVLLAALLAVDLGVSWRVSQAEQAVDAADASIAGANRAIDDALESREQVRDAEMTFMSLRLSEKVYLQFFDETDRGRFEALSRQLSHMLAELKNKKLADTYQSYADLFGETVALSKRHAAVKAQMGKPLAEGEAQVRSIIAELEALQASRQMEGEDLEADEAEMMNVARDCNIVLLKLQNLQQQFVATGDHNYIEAYKELAAGDAALTLTAMAEFAQALKRESFIAASNKARDAVAALMKSIEESMDLGLQEAQLIQNLDKTGSEMRSIAATMLDAASTQVQNEKNVAKEARRRAEASKSGADQVADTAYRVKAAVVIGGAVVYLLLSLPLIVGINRALKASISELGENSRLVWHSATQVADASRTLASNATQQAASLEEVSSSMEEMSAVTKNTSSNAAHAKELMKRAQDIVEKANADMDRMTESMAEITSTSKRTQTVIKTIEEIAFQTNLLALNAAVEAARAGSAGAGFAVVADEVRSLAVRTADAAGRTAELIEGSVAQINKGASLLTDTSQSFGEVAVNARQVNDLVVEISQASGEQADGIEQINTAVASMDAATQQNAATAEESASTAEALNAQADRLNATIAGLAGMVNGAAAAAGGGACDHDGEPPEQERGGAATRRQELVRCKPARHPRQRESVQEPKKPKRETRHAQDPAQIIPLDDDDLGDF